MGKSEIWIFGLLCIVLQFEHGTSSGHLYVGFLTYDNERNGDYHGNCCDDIGDVELKCEMFCDLVFYVSIFTLDGRNITNKSLSHGPISDSNHIQFGDLEEIDLQNPMVFDFDAWPGVVRVVVSVYDHDDNKPTAGGSGDDVQLVDVIQFNITDVAHSPMFTYEEVEGERPGQKSVLGVVFRYDCEVLYTGRKCGNACTAGSQIGCTNSKPVSTDCSELTTGASSTETTTTTTTFSTENTTYVMTSSTTETTTTINKSTTKTSIFESSVFSELTTETTEKSTSTNVQKSTSSSPNVTSPSRQPSDKTQTTVLAVSHGRVTTSDSPSVTPTLGSPSVTPTLGSPSVTPTLGSPSVTPTLGSPSVTPTLGSPSVTPTLGSPSVTPTLGSPSVTPTLGSPSVTPTLGSPSVTPTLGSPFQTPDLDNWEIILGCLLGAVSLLSAIGYLVFYKRQKSLLRRKEMYKVTPEMLSIVEENGITVRSDIPVETNSSST